MDLVVAIVWAATFIAVVAMLHYAPPTITINHTYKTIKTEVDMVSEEELKKVEAELEKPVSFSDALAATIEELGGLSG